MKTQATGKIVWRQEKNGVYFGITNGIKGIAFTIRKSNIDNDFILVDTRSTKVKASRFGTLRLAMAEAESRIEKQNKKGAKK